MGDELQDLQNNLSNLPDQELLRIVTVELASYRAEAVAIAREELRRRGIEDPSPELYRKVQELNPPNPSPKMSAAQSRRMAWLWPSVADAESARKASKQAVIAALFCVGATVLFSVLGTAQVEAVSKMGFNLWSLLDAALFAFVALGVYKLSRAAAVGGLALYVLERADMWATEGIQNPYVAFIIVLAFVNGVRGTFAYHRLVGLTRADALRPIEPQ